MSESTSASILAKLAKELGAPPIPSSSNASRSITISEGIGIWSNNPERLAGSFDQQLGKELCNFLDECLRLKCHTIMLFLDSGGVSLKEPWQGMQGVAQAIKKIHHINCMNGTKTISLFGTKWGVFGGALLLAGACQYSYAEEQTLCGVSGPKVIAALTGQSYKENLNLYRTSHRLKTGEIDYLTPPASELLSEISALPCRTLTKVDIQRRLSNLGDIANKARHNGWIDLPAVPSLKNLQEAAAELIELFSYKKVIPELSGNLQQPFSFSNECLGFSRYLGTLAATIRYIVENGGDISIRVNGHGSGATFIAFSMMASKMQLEPGTQIDALPPSAIQAITGVAGEPALTIPKEI